MRRFWYWYLPLAIAIVFSSVFAYGFYMGVRGGIGRPINVASNAPRQATRGVDARSILILGDSLARGTGDQTGLGIGGRLDAELKRLNVPHRSPTNLAVNGSRTADLLATLGSTNVRRLVGEAGVIVLSIGGNDLFGAAAAQNPERQPVPANPAALLDEMESRVARVIETLRAANATARIYYVGLYDPFARRPFGAITSRAVTEWNARIARRFAGDRNFVLVQTSDIFLRHDERLSFDHFHPGAEGYALIARRIAESF